MYSQGWLVNFPSKGTFVNEQLPEVSPRKLAKGDEKISFPSETGFSFKINPLIHPASASGREITGFHDGADYRLTPSDLISRTYKSILQRKTGQILLSYMDVQGRSFVRQAISDYLNNSRGLQTKAENIFMTRGTQMAMFLLSNVLIEKNDIVVAARISYRYADLVFLNAGAKIERVTVDENGLDIDEVEKICKKKKIRAVYVTSHHHYPTTVTLSAARRMKLLQLAEKYRFIIIEDDYDYEFHYDTSPILPLASADRCGMVIYIGSFSKTISPGIRVGYIVAPQNLIPEIGKYRMIVDAQGDSVLEQVVAELLNEGEIRRHLKKALKIYHERRNHLCNLLDSELNGIVDFKIPDGGLSIWTRFDKKISLPELSSEMKKKGVVLSNGLIHDKAEGKKLNATRMGFGWMNQTETDHAMGVLVDCVKRVV